MRLTAALAIGLLASLCACHSGKADHGPNIGPTIGPGGVVHDGFLYAAIKAKLAGADIDSATRISVAIKGGAVTLSGNVKDRATKERAVALVRAVRGVRSVDDRLGIGHARKSVIEAVQDAGLVAAVATALTEQAGINVASLQIDASNGTVTLGGSAATSAIKSTVLATAKKTPGVRKLVDRIVVK